MSASNLHTAWAKLFLRSLAGAGVTDVVLSPGSRSTPLAIAAAREPRIRLHVIIDERAAAFFALGQARVTGRPSALVCTSGTAGAHYLPALIEASASYLPVIAITADRPWELQGVAAPQTIDQRKLFGDFARAHLDLGVPDPSPGAIASVPRLAAQAVCAALGPVPGPVHVNAPFRKPLEPVTTAAPEAWEPAMRAVESAPLHRVHAPIMRADPAAITELAELIAVSKRGLVVAGPAKLAAERDRAAIFALARAAGYPIVAEATSQLRFGGDGRGALRISAIDPVLDAHPSLDLDLVIEIGAPPTSSAYASFTARTSAARVVIAPFGWNDPTSRAARLILADPAEVAASVAERLGEPRAPSPITRALGLTDHVARSIADEASSPEMLSEGVIARAIVDSAPEGAILAVGNSTPVRDLDLYCPPSDRALGVLHQRGASGIDGLVAGAAGAASVTDRPVALLLGDVSLTHDLTSLAIAARAERPLPIVVVNNGGGRIFDLLPIADSAESAEMFERCFATPPRVDLCRAASALGAASARVETRSALAAALAAAWARPGATLIEAVSPARQGASIRRRIRDDLRARLHDLGPDTTRTRQELP